MIINCQHCSGPILKDAKLESVGPASFEMKIKCPHCQRPIAVRITNILEAHVRMDGKIIERTGDSEGVRVL